MRIINVNKYISYIENNNLTLYFYKKDLFSIINKYDNILYIKNKKDINNINIDTTNYKIIENKFIETVYNNIQLNNMIL